MLCEALGSAPLDFPWCGVTLPKVSAVRSRWFAFLAVFLWATAGALATDRCACDDVASSCEHAGKACAQDDGCSDCFKPAASAVIAEDVVALAPQAKPQVFLPAYEDAKTQVCIAAIARRWHVLPPIAGLLPSHRSSMKSEPVVSS